LPGEVGNESVISRWKLVILQFSWRDPGDPLRGDWLRLAVHVFADIGMEPNTGFRIVELDAVQCFQRSDTDRQFLSEFSFKTLFAGLARLDLPSWELPIPSQRGILPSLTDQDVATPHNNRNHHIRLRVHLSSI